MRPSAIRNARWLAFSRLVSIGVQFVGLLWLSRLLTPADYGLVAMALVVTGFAELVRDMGISSALIQKEELNDEVILTAFWFTSAMGAALGILVAALAPLLALTFKAPDLTGILLLLALTFPILGSTTVHQALLERRSRFPLLARIEAASGVSALGVGLIAAYLGAGAYSLVLQTMTYAVVSSGQLWFASDLRPRWLWSWEELRGIRKFADYLVAFSVICYLSATSDRMIIGRFLGAASLGPYSLAHRIILFPVQNLTRVAARALYPIMSRQQSAPEEMALLYLRTLSVIAFITAPMMAGLLVLRELVVLVVLGNKWTLVADILAWLAYVAFARSLTCTTGSVLLAKGRSDILLYLGIAGALIEVPSFIIGLNWGVIGVAAGLCISTAISSVWDFYFVLKVLGQGVSRFFLSVWTPMALSGVMALIVWGCKTFLPLGTIAPVGQLALLVCIGAASYAALALAFARGPLRETSRLIGRT
jgi:O-antigen/teichoic acid export membrane protein